MCAVLKAQNHNNERSTNLTSAVAAAAAAGKDAKRRPRTFSSSLFFSPEVTEERMSEVCPSKKGFLLYKADISLRNGTLLLIDQFDGLSSQ